MTPISNRCLLFAVGLLATASCESKPAKQGQGSAAPVVAPTSGSAAVAAAPPASPLAQVQAWAPKGASVAPAELSVPGVELFAVTPAKPSDEDFPAGALVGIAGGKLVEGRELVVAAAAGKPDARTLARLVMWTAQDDGELLLAAATPEQRAAKVTAPAIYGTMLKLWAWTTDAPRVLERGSADLTTGAVEIAPLPVKPELMISRAILTLSGSSVRRHVGAIQLLAASCANPRARQSLFAALSSHTRDRTRAAIADEVHKCGAAAVDPLIYSMENDKAAMVRARAATGLGRAGDPRARFALGKAARSEDANLAWAAKNALGKLK